MKFLILFLFVALSQDVHSLPEGCNCGTSAIRAKMVEGHDGNLVPFQVSVQSKEHICHGIILDEQTVISSASCLTAYQASDIQIVAGIDRLDEKTDSNTYAISSIHLPDSYNSDVGTNNTAILKLTNKLKLEDGKIEKACVRMYEKPFKKASFSGFGSTQQHSLTIDGKISPKPKPSNKIQTHDFKLTDYHQSADKWVVESDTDNDSAVCLLDEGASLYVMENDKTYTIGIADQALLGPDPDDVNLQTMCVSISAFIKFSSVDFFVKQYATSGMCLIYEN